MRSVTFKLSFIVVICFLFPLASCQTISSETDTDRIPAEQVEISLREQVLRENPDMNPSVHFRLQEITTSEIWKRLHIQLFEQQYDYQQNDHPLGWGPNVVLVNNGRIEFLEGWTDIKSLIVTDLDSNNLSELIYVSSWGSGIIRSHIDIYLPDDQDQKILNNVPDLVLGEYILRKRNDQTVIVKAKAVIYGYQTHEIIQTEMGQLWLTNLNGKPELGIDLNSDIPDAVMDYLE